MLSAELVKLWFAGFLLALVIVPFEVIGYSRSPHHKGRAKAKVIERNREYMGHHCGYFYSGRYVFEVDGKEYSSSGRLSEADYLFRRVRVHYDPDYPARCCTWCEDAGLWIFLLPISILIVWTVAIIGRPFGIG